MPKFNVKITGFRSWYWEIEAEDASMAEHIAEQQLNTRFGDRREWGFEVFAYSVNGEDF